jgi:NADP+-dependent farnesol dehydrogenase
MLQSLSPGLVETDLVPDEFRKRSTLLNPEDIAAGVLYVLGAPPHVQVYAMCDVSLYRYFARFVSFTSMEQSFAREDDIC